MLYRSFISVVLAASFALIAAAQDPQADDSGSEQPERKDSAPAAAGTERSVLPPLKGGDKLYLTSGTVMTGVQVLRATPQHYEVQISEGEPPFLIPRRQVSKVEYDDVDPLRERLRRELFPEQEEVTIASGERVTGALRDKLEAPVSPSEPLSYQDQDFIKVLDEVRLKTGVKLKIDPSIQEKPANQRRWSVQIPTDKTLLVLLREDLVSSFTYVEVVLEADNVIVMTTEAAATRGTPSASKGPTEGQTPAVPDGAPPAPSAAPSARGAGLPK